MDNESEQHNTKDTELCSGSTTEEGEEGGKEDEELIKEGINCLVSMPYPFWILIALVVTILLCVIGYYIGLQNGFDQCAEQYAGKIFLN